MKQRIYALFPARLGGASTFKQGRTNIEEIAFCDASRYTEVERRWMIWFWVSVVMFKAVVITMGSMYIKAEVERRVAERLMQIKPIEYAAKK